MTLILKDEKSRISTCKIDFFQDYTKVHISEGGRNLYFEKLYEKLEGTLTEKHDTLVEWIKKCIYFARLHGEKNMIFDLDEKLSAVKIKQDRFLGRVLKMVSDSSKNMRTQIQEQEEMIKKQEKMIRTFQNQIKEILVEIRSSASKQALVSAKKSAFGTLQYF